MAKHRIVFATNRQQLQPSPSGMPRFNDEPTPFTPSGLICATATVDKIDITKPSSGEITAISTLHSTGFSEDDLAPIIASKNNILVFIHGAANTFVDSITRAAYNQEWLAKANIDGVNTNFDVIAFSWPATDYQYWFLPGDLDNYRHDQKSAQNSAYHLGAFFRELYKLKARIASSGRGMSLLAHSMGNWALGFAVENWFKDPNAPKDPLFDEVILAAADEHDIAFSAAKSGHFANLHRLGREITVYFNRNDVAMELSHLANGDTRLGYDGPPNAADLSAFPLKIFEFVDCTHVDDYISTWLDAPDRTHQYYRQSPKVRIDIATNLAGLVPKRPKYDAKANWYILFPKADPEWES